jgi:hypothetical protein
MEVGRPRLVREASNTDEPERLGSCQTSKPYALQSKRPEISLAIQSTSGASFVGELQDRHAAFRGTALQLLVY